LISRRNVARTGARYHCRGIDSQGNVANFVETEQIICTPEGRCASFLQIRGSIPLFWRQNVRIKYKPELEIVSTTHHEPAFLLHRDSTLKAYKQVSVVNLVDSHGGEARLSTVFHKLSNNPQQDWKYTEFDFHAECRNMAYHNIAKLVKQLESDLNAHGYFEGHLKQQENKSDSDNFTIRGQILKTQNGIVRTNCMDCLDRTNVVQSVLARRALLAQFKDFEIVPSETGEDFGPFGDAMVGIFRNVWADNADAISTQYSGTGALKTDFTRTGKRSPMGALQDGINSALRYYFGNFTDGHRQDALNLLFGAYKVSPSNYSSPFSISPSDPIKIILLWALILLILLFFLSAHFNYNSGLILSASLIVAILHYIRNNGKRFTQKPRLIQMVDQDKKNN
jgi:phosphatidylinositol 4-phosphatase